MKTLILGVGAVLAVLLYWVLRRQRYQREMIEHLQDALSQSYPSLNHRTGNAFYAHMNRWYANRSKETATA